MQKVVKKSFMSVVACLMACMMFAMPVFFWMGQSRTRRY